MKTQKNTETLLGSNRLDGEKNHGTRHASALAVGLTPERAYELLQSKLPAAELRGRWNYRAFGLKIDDAKRLLAKCASETESKKRRQNNDTTFDAPESLPSYPYCPKVQDYLKRKQARDSARTKNLRELAGAPEAENLEEINEYLRGFGHGYECKVRLGVNWLLLERIEDATWEKNRHWPVTQTTAYRAQLINAEGDATESYRFSARRGDWLGQVGAGLGLPCVARTAVTQSSALIPVSEKERRNIRFTTLRLYGLGVTEVAAQGFGTTFHAPTVREALAGLVLKARKKKKVLRKYLDDSAILTIEDAENLGFCGLGVREFLREIALEDRQKAKVGEIRRRMRSHDISPWVTELVSIGLLRSLEE